MLVAVLFCINYDVMVRRGNPRAGNDTESENFVVRIGQVRWGGGGRKDSLLRGKTREKELLTLMPTWFLHKILADEWPQEYVACGEYAAAKHTHIILPLLYTDVPCIHTHTSQYNNSLGHRARTSSTNESMSPSSSSFRQQFCSCCVCV